MTHSSAANPNSSGHLPYGIYQNRGKRPTVATIGVQTLLQMVSAAILAKMRAGASLAR